MKKYKRLRAKIIEECVTQKELADILGISRTSMSHSFTAQRSFTLDEAYKILEVLKVPHAEICVYFPKGGV